MSIQSNPTYLAGLAARNRFTETRQAIKKLEEHMPDQAGELRALYNDLCQAQGVLEKILEDIPPFSQTA